MPLTYPTQARLLELFEDVGDTLKRRVAIGKAQTGDTIRSIGNMGYYRVSVDGKRYLVHRLLWLMRTGVLAEEIDHADGNPLNNRPDNLRAVSRSQNMWNQKPGPRRGVYPYGRQGRWYVKVQAHRRLYNGGVFNDYNEACAAADALRAQLHGEYSRKEA